MKTKKILITLLGAILLVSATLATLAACGEPPELTDVQLLYYADKSTYVVGEKFDPTGLDITAVYSDGTRKQITDYTIDKTGALTLDDTVITITYQSYSFEQKISVIRPGDVIILQFTQGVDSVTLYADGGVYAQRISTVKPTTRTAGASWSWDGEEIEILIAPGTNDCQPKDFELTEDGKQKVNLIHDAQNNLTFNYIFQRWSISGVCPYRVWSAALEGKTFPIAQD